MQPQAGGVEFVVGGVRDAGFGPVVMVGLGGTSVEVLGDVRFAETVSWPISASQ